MFEHLQLADVFGVDHYRAEAFERLLSSATEHRTDRQRAVIAFQACQSKAEFMFVRRLYLRRREAWIDGLCWTQRRWQSRVPKNPKKCRHHDSWPLREKYVRCQGDYHEHMAYSKEVRKDG